MTESEPSPPPIKRPAFARFGKAIWAFAGIILPLVAFGCAAPAGNWAADSPWQSGEFWVYATLVMKWPAVWPFYPLLLLSMTSLGLFLWDRDRYAELLAVRLGLYGGVILALQFCWLLYSPTDKFGPAVGKTLLIVTMILGLTQVVIVVLLIAAIVLNPWFKRMRRRWGWKRPALSLVTIVAGLTLFQVVVFDDSGEWLLTPPVIVLFLLLVVSPAWAFAAYACAAFDVFRRSYKTERRWSLLSLFAIITWATCLFGAWRRAMDLAIREYATLPVENPNCFVCTAAARGHQQLVGSEPVFINESIVVWINRQLRVLKAAELAMVIVAPCTHRSIRRVYNLIGPGVAARMSNRWAADAAYLALKPTEWIAYLGLRTMGVRNDTIAHVYSGDE
jgi:hypothetical protein